MKNPPSILNAAATVTATTMVNDLETLTPRLYITAVLCSTTLNVDSGGNVSCGPINFQSPIRCKTFSATAKNHVAYYELSH